MTKEEMLALMKVNNEKMQEEFMAKLLDQIELLNEKANKKDYEPTSNEREMFRKIYTIITNMNNWF